MQRYLHRVINSWEQRHLHPETQMQTHLPPKPVGFWQSRVQQQCQLFVSKYLEPSDIFWGDSADAGDEWSHEGWGENSAKQGQQGGIEELEQQAQQEQRFLVIVFCRDDLLQRFVTWW